MTPEEALEATRKIDDTKDATFAYMTTLENGHIYIKAIYPNTRHIGQESQTYVFDSTTGVLVRSYGGK